MSEMKYCQGPNCHTYETQDRIRGPKGNKYYQTRRRSSFYYLGGNACSMNSQNDGFEKFGEQAVNHFGRIVEPIRLTPDNAWRKEYDYHYQPNSDNHQRNWRFVNRLTKETRSLTKEQYDDDNLVRP